MTRLKADVILLFVAMVWGFAFIGQASAMAHIGPLAFSGWRFAIAALLLAPLALRESRRSPTTFSPVQILGCIVMGVVFFAASAAQQWGLLHTSVTNAGFLTALYVILVPIIGVVFLAEKARASIWIGGAVSVLGTLLLSGGGDFRTLNWGDALIVASALCWAIQITLVGLLTRDLSRPFTIAFCQFTVTAILGIVLGFLFETPQLPEFDKIATELIFTGLLSGGVCFTLQILAQRHSPSSDAAILMSTEGLFAALGGAVFLGERLGVLGWTGCSLIIGAVLLVQLAPELVAKRERTPTN